MSRKILVLEDEANIRSFIIINLKRAGYETIEAGTGQDALDQIRHNPDIDVALLDVMLPDTDGFEVCRRIRGSNKRIGIIMLTARIDALCRRATGETIMSTDEITYPPFRLSIANRTLEKNGQQVKLTQVEYSIIKLFMENTGKALPREEILETVWGKDYIGEAKIVDVNIRRLRIKIEDDAQNPKFINTVWGYGYKWGS